MSRRTPFIVVISCLALLTATVPISVHAQRRGGHPPNPPGHFAVRGHGVFVGGYFYDPHFGPYPWWGPGVYPYWYMPLYGVRASVRILATPKEAACTSTGSMPASWTTSTGFFNPSRCPPGSDPFLSRYAPGGGMLWGHRHRVPLGPFGSATRFPGMEPVGNYPIVIIVKNGHITLMGEVDNESDKTIAGMKAKGVPGAFGVENELTWSSIGSISRT